jgi:hypothetical protein
VRLEIVHERASRQSQENPSMKIKAIIVIWIVSLGLYAQDDFYSMNDDVFDLSAFEVSTASSRGYDPRFRGGNLSNNPIRLVKRADIVTLELTVSTDDKKPDKRISYLQDAFRTLKESVANRDDIVMKSGYVELPLATSDRWVFSSAKSGDEVSSFNLKLITKMGLEDTVFDRSAFLNTFIDELDLGPNVKIFYVSSGIALLEPNKYRKELLKLISDEVDLLKSIFGATIGYQLRSLDQKINVGQIDEVNLELSLPYQLVLSSDDD